MITIKLKYKVDESYKDIIMMYMEHYSKCLRFMYNRICDDPSVSDKELRSLSKSINGISLLNAYQIQCSIMEARQLYDANGKGIIFGGKSNFIKRCQDKISKEDWKILRNNPINVMGAAPQKGNRNFRIDTSNHKIVFQPNRNLHIDLIYSDKLRGEYKSVINSSEYLQNNKLAPISYKLDLNFVYVTVDESKLKEVKKFHQIENRVFAIDLNPNYIGWSVTDWSGDMDYKIVDRGTISIKKINDIEYSLKKMKLNSSSKERVYLSDKRNYEVYEVSKFLVNKAVHYGCKLFSVEDLNMKSKDSERGRGYNRLVNNQWNRSKLVDNLKKRCNINSIRFVEVKPNYSSFIGNIIYRSEGLPDMELASIEIGRRAYEFNAQHIDKTKEKNKNIIQPEITNRIRTIVHQSLEELMFSENYDDLIGLYYKIKNSGLKYRVPLDERQEFFRLFSKKSMILMII